MPKKRPSGSETAPPAEAGAPARRRTAAASHKKHQPAGSAGELRTGPAAHAAATCQPAHQEIALLAYSYWVSRGCQDGFAEEDWLRAEKELRRAAQAANN